ncbi:MAG TPA: HK97 family phage prohead protease [Thermoplasmata archaeon]|nr:HK97 family phage prohead protease [Thermoplasmata archaeon]
MQTKLLTTYAKLTKTPTDGSGTFEAIVAGWDIDSDNDRFARDAFDGLDGSEPIPLRYQHVPDAADPASNIGVAFVTSTDAGLKAAGQLDLNNPMGMAVYERMLLPASDAKALREFSVGFAFEPAKTFKGDKGETVIPKAKLIEISIVYKGSQRTELLSIKNTGPRGTYEPTAAAITNGANHLAQSAVEALRGGLFAEQQVLQQASRNLRLVLAGTGDVQTILTAVRPIVAALRSAGRTIGADNLARTLDELDAAYDGKAAGKTMTGTQARALIASATTVEGNALVQFAEMKKEVIRSYPGMAKSVFGELTTSEKKALAAQKARAKAAFDGPPAEWVEPEIDARFRVINPPARDPDRSA